MSEEKICFVIMPISDIPEYEKGHFNDVYDYIIKPAVTKAGFKPLRADEVKKSDIIIIDILKKIYNSSMCICDLSSRNPNVLYELGLRQAFNLPVTIIKDSKTPRIFDIQGYRDIVYDENLRYNNVKSAIDIISDTIINTNNNFDVDGISIAELIGAKKNSELEKTQKNVINYNLEYIINKYLDEKAREGLREKTLNNYRNELNIFKNFTNKNVNEITREDIKQYLIHREDNFNINLRSSMVSIKAVLNSFFAWLEIENIVIPNPIKGIKNYKSSENVTRSLTNGELEKIRNVSKGTREYIIIEFFISTGCRLSEITKVKIQDINWNNKTIKLTDAKERTRIIPANEELLNLLKEYINDRKANCYEIFTSLRKPYQKLGPRSYEQIIKNAINKANLDNKISPEFFRSTFSRILSEKGCPTNILNALLGLQDTQKNHITSYELTTHSINQIYSNYFINW